MASPRRDALRQYLLSVTTDLLARGIVRKARGQSIEEVLRSELQIVLAEVLEDLKGVGAEMVGGLVAGAISGMFRRGG